MLYEYFIFYECEDGVKGMCGVKRDEKIETFQGVVDLAKNISEEYHAGKPIIISNFILLNVTFGG